MKTQLLPNSFTDKIADPKERRRICGTPLTSPERQAREDLKLERELHKLICLELSRREIVFIHSRTDRKATIGVGLPDFCFVIRSIPIAVEVKTESGKLTPEQVSTRLKMIENGWQYFIVRSFTDFAEVMRWHQTEHTLECSAR